ncbi:Bacteriophage lambda head decoration protein D [Gammaproteobacteria bacterium]
MTIYTEPQRPFEFVLTEGDGTISRDTVTIASGNGELPAGMVLGKITASGKYAPYDNTAATGIEVARSVLLEPVDATSSDVSGAVLIRLAEVKTSALQWDAANDAAAKTAGLSDLATQYLIAR